MKGLLYLRPCACRLRKGMVIIMKVVLYLFLVLAAISIMGCSASKDSKDTDSGNITKEAENDITKPVSPTPTVVVNQNMEGSVMEAEIQSDAIAKNIIGDNATRKIYIYLPPTYNSSDKTYPVVYFLHGYGDSPKSFMTMYEDKLNEAFSRGAEEFILVALDGNNKTGGSFFVNSPVSGNWEDFVVNEVVGYMDTNYRTIADNASRGISGYSMGGFGALYLSLRHPDVYNSALVFCPGVFAEDALDEVLASWKYWYDVNISYAQAFSPNTEDTENYGNIIKEADVEAKNSVWEDWMNGYSNWGQKLDDYLALDKPLKAIEIAYSLEDSFTWIPGGCQYLAGLLKEKNINYSSIKFDGGHIVPYDGIESYFVPFFGENLTY